MTDAERARWREEADGTLAMYRERPPRTGDQRDERDDAERILALLDAVERLTAERDQYARTGRILADTLHVTSEERDALRAALARAEAALASYKIANEAQRRSAAVMQAALEAIDHTCERAGAPDSCDTVAACVQWLAADRTALRARVAQLEGEAAGLAHALTTAGEERERLVREKKALRERAERAEQAWRDRGGTGSRPGCPET
jgi:DNA repair exonuclease SbcCD ATPase subunit